MSRRCRVAAAVVGVTIVVTGAVVALLGNDRAPLPHKRTAIVPQPVNPSLPSSTSQVFAPTTTVPADSPVQQQYDQGFVQGFRSAANRAEFARVASQRLPGPAISGGWPHLQPAYTPESWTREFVTALLDIDFAHQSRVGLAGWLVAEEAPDLLPGIPTDAQLGWLPATLLDPQPSFGSRSPIPSDAQWDAYAHAGVRWSVGDLHVQLDPQWQAMVAAGWQPVDEYASVEDVAGVLTITDGSTTATRNFGLDVQLGSARWHPGYGTVLAGQVG